MEIVGNYRIEAKLAEGGMGAVYRATHQLLGRPAAVKVLLPELSTNREIVNRFFNEARAATSVRHPGIVEVYDFGYLPSGTAFLVMELLDGEPLSRCLARAGRLDESLALLYLRGMASALAAAHAKGIVHRDLKPDNVFLVPDPDMPGGVRVKLLDFGIAKVAEAARGRTAATKTRTGSLMGTPTYMSPEQCRGAGEVDHRTDLYGLGCIVYEMVTGQPPFVADGPGDILAAHILTTPLPPSQVAPGISANLDALALCLLAKRPEDRMQSAAELVRLLGPPSSPMIQGSIAAPTVALAVPTQSTAIPAGVRVQPVPTTLSTAASQSTPVTKRSRATWLAIGIVTAAVIAIAAVRITREANDIAAATQRDAELPDAAVVTLTDAEPMSPADVGTMLDARALVAPARDGVVDAGVTLTAKPVRRTDKKTTTPPAKPVSAKQDTKGSAHVDRGD